MENTLQSFADLYLFIQKQKENSSYLNHREQNLWKSYSKAEFLATVRYLSLAFAEEGWCGKQIAIAISPSSHWLMLDYALSLCGAVSVPLFTNISTRNLRFQIEDADLHTAFTQDPLQKKIILEADSGIHCIHLGIEWLARDFGIAVWSRISLPKRATTRPRPQENGAASLRRVWPAF
jgi:long-chain acyl-CoA synthetase